jgi:glycosyltransferase involved in cell wall biosynthesis
VRHRIEAMRSLCEVVVVAPVPWAPAVRSLGARYYRYSQVPAVEDQNGLRVEHPRFAVIPRVLKTSAAGLMALSCVGHLRTLRRTFPFDVIDAHWAYPDGVAAVLLARLLGVPCAVTVRGDDVNVFAEEFGRGQLIRWGLSHADLVVALSNDLRDRVVRLTGRDDHSVVISNGVDTQRFAPAPRQVARQRLGVGLEEQIVLAVGRLHTSKGFHVLVDAFGALKSSHPALRVVVAGDPDPEADATPAIRAACERHEISDRISLIGAQPQHVLADWYSAADLFCLPTSREGSANVLNEALACGLPCITTPVGGNPSVITGPELGMLVEPEARAFAGAMKAALARSWDRDAIANAARRRPWSVVAAECHSHLARLIPSGAAEKRV